MDRIGLGARLWMALTLPWRVLGNGALAARIRAADRVAALPGGAGETPPAAVAEPVGDASVPAASAGPTRTPEPGAVAQVAEAVSDPTPALQLLTILQREGRLLDFLQEDIAAYSDAEIGAAARVVHEGCRRGLDDYVELRPVRSDETEGDAITLEPGYDPARTRVTGNVVGEPPFRGTLAHRGWRVATIRLPKLNAAHDPTIVAPAEVELA